MPKCPECGHNEDSVLNWFRYPDGDNSGVYVPGPMNGSGDGTLALVVCPNCAAVLGGGGYAHAHDAY